MNAVSRVRTDETARLRSTSVSETENKSLSAAPPSLVNPYPSNPSTFSVFESFGWPVGLFTEQQIDVVYSCVCSGVCTAHTAECVSVFAVLLWAAVVWERSGWHFKVVRQQLCHDKNIVSEPEETRKQQHCSTMSLVFLSYMSKFTSASSECENQNIRISWYSPGC